MRKIIILFLLLALAGCGFVFQNFDQNEHKDLTFGMSKQEVINKIGQPQKISKMIIDNKEYDVWEYPNNNRAKIEKMNALGIIYSEVLFLDGKLTQRDKNRVYGQPGYEYLESISPEGGVKATKVGESKKDLK